VRAIGSFSSAIGLSSFLTPVAVFALVLGFLMPRARLLAWTVAGLALVGLIGSYSRASLFGVALGVCCGLLLVFVAADMPGRRKLGAAGLVILTLAGTYGGLLVASEASPQLRDRAKGVLDPLGDESVKLRFKTWRRNLDDAIDHPLGQGVGAVGAASAPTRTNVRTTDNSFLKVLVEQGVFGLALFAGGMLGAVILLARRLRRAAAEYRPVGLAALAGFVAFLGISFAGESVEQPGKVAAWGLLGVAAAQAFAGTRGPFQGTEGEGA
jgi:O-antigen ligase